MSQNQRFCILKMCPNSSFGVNQYQQNETPGNFIWLQSRWKLLPWIPPNFPINNMVSTSRRWTCFFCCSFAKIIHVRHPSCIFSMIHLTISQGTRGWPWNLLPYVLKSLKSGGEFLLALSKNLAPTSILSVGQSYWSLDSYSSGATCWKSSILMFSCSATSPSWNLRLSE